jgi:uncharacterized protein YdeI (YjbR/CyaY-like superfamily)
MSRPPAEPVFFATPADFRRWLQKNHRTEPELLVGFYKRGSGEPSITWQESVDEALCFGWIDGVRRSLDERRYTIRFSPRRERSIWSAINIRRAQELLETGRMRKAGRDAFERRREDRSRRYSYEQEGAKLAGEYERRMKATPKAWAYYSAQPAWYRRTTAWWVMSAKKEETRRKRLERLIAVSAKSEWIEELRRTKKEA